MRVSLTRPASWVRMVRGAAYPAAGTRYGRAEALPHAPRSDALNKFRQTRHAEKGQRDGDLGFQQFEDLNDTRLSGGSQPVTVEAADRHRFGAERDRLDDVGAAA